MCSVLTFADTHPIVTVVLVLGVALIFTIGVCAHLSERLERKYGGRDAV